MTSLVTSKLGYQYSPGTTPSRILSLRRPRDPSLVCSVPDSSSTLWCTNRHLNCLALSTLTPDILIEWVEQMPLSRRDREVGARGAPDTRQTWPGPPRIHDHSHLYIESPKRLQNSVAFQIPDSPIK